MNLSFHKTPKVVSGLDDIAPRSLATILKIYSPVVETLVPVSCVEVVEMSKLHENGPRMVGLVYANEMADTARLRNLNPFEIIQASATKNFGFSHLTPGLGVGGHCIPANARYLFQTTSSRFWNLLRKECLNVRLLFPGQS